MKEFKVNDFIELENVAAWQLIISPILDPKSPPYKIAPYEKSYMKMTFGEIEAHIKRRNTYFIGFDPDRNHALLRIVDPEARKALLNIDKEQIMLTDDAIKQLFACKNKESYQKMLDKLIATKAEAQTMRFKWDEIDFDSMNRWKENMLAEKIEEFLPPLEPDLRQIKYYDKEPAGARWHF